MIEWLPLLSRGLLLTVAATVSGFVLAVGIAFVAGLATLSRFRAVRVVVKAYVEVFRGTSALVQIYFFFFVLPFLGVNLSPLVAGVAALGLNFGAYGSEIVRGAIEAIPRGQSEASFALGLSRGRQLRRILIPQALPTMVPPFGNLLVDLMKATSLLSMITVSDLAFVGKQILQAEGDPVMAYVPVLIIYFLFALVLGRVSKGAERVVDLKVAHREVIR